MSDPIRIKKDSVELPDDEKELCYFCLEPTSWWSVKVNVPVCPRCSKLNRLKDIDMKEYMTEEYFISY